MCLKSFNLPGFLSLPFLSHSSLVFPPFQAFVVKPNISTLILHFSSVAAIMSVVRAAIIIGLPRIEPELSISNDTAVSSNLISFSFLKDKELLPLVIILVSFEVSKSPDSKSKFQDLFCFDWSNRKSLLANLDICF